LQLPGILGGALALFLWFLKGSGFFGGAEFVGAGFGSGDGALVSVLV